MRHRRSELVVLVGTAVLSAASGIAFAEGLGAEVECSVWQSSGQAFFQIGAPAWVISEVEYPMDGVLAELRGSAPVFSQDMWDIKARGRFASQLSYEGTSKDSDFVDFPGIRSDYSESDSTADVLIWDADVMLTLKPFAFEDEVLGSIEIGVFAGYGSQTFDYEDRNLTYYVLGSPFTAYDGPVSTYKLEFTGARVGVCAAVRPFPSLKLSAEVVLVPGLAATGDGYWILRAYSFQQQAEGDGLLVNLKGAWQIMETLEVFVAYRSVEFTADKNGVESGHDRSSGNPPYSGWPIIPQIAGEYTGLECGVSVSF